MANADGECDKRHQKSEKRLRKKKKLLEDRRLNVTNITDLRR